jgi:hypothetical protein
MTTPLQLIATAGLYQNTGIAANTAMLTAISSYETLSLIAPLLIARIAGATANIPNVTPGGANTSRFSTVTIANLNSLGTATCSALADTVPSSVTGVTLTNTIPGLSGAIKVGAATVIPADLTQFMQAFNQADGYVQITNRVINTSRNSATFLGPTFTNMNALTTGDISNVTRDPAAFGADLVRLGNLIDLSRLGELGTPSQLLRQLIITGGLTPGVEGALNDAGVATDIVNNLRDGNYELADSLQNAAYRAMLTVTGDNLAQVLDILDVTTAGILTMADLLNPYKLFPNSFQTLTAPTNTSQYTLANVYVDSSGTVNSNLKTLLPVYYIEIAV